MAAHFEPIVDANCRLVAPPPTRRTAIGGYPKVAFYDIVGDQLHYSNPVKHGGPTIIVTGIGRKTSLANESLMQEQVFSGSNAYLE